MKNKEEEKDLEISRDLISYIENGQSAYEINLNSDDENLKNQIKKRLLTSGKRKSVSINAKSRACLIQ
jgi:hypothetical protein